MVTCNARDKFLLAKSTKKVFRRVNFTNLKTPSGYIAKSKPQGVCLQLSQTLGGDYAIWPKKKKPKTEIFVHNRNNNSEREKAEN